MSRAKLAQRKNIVVHHNAATYSGITSANKCGLKWLSYIWKTGKSCIAKTVPVVTLLVINTYSFIFFHGLVPVTQQTTTFILATIFLSGNSCSFDGVSSTAAGND